MSSKSELVLRFLQGTKTSESMLPEVAELILAPTILSNGTRLDDVLNTELETKNVVVTGSAGGGKTALVRSVVRNREHTTDLGRQDPNVVLVVEDLTALSSQVEIDQFLKQWSLGRCLVAANEGALHSREFATIFEPVVLDLQAIQSGTQRSSGNVAVVDLAAIEPYQSALASLLPNQVLHNAVATWERNFGCADDIETCPRMLALTQLQDPLVSKYVANLISCALSDTGMLYRDVWNWLEDILLRGSCSPGVDGVPTSCWFYRAFYGDTKVAKILKDRLLPEFLALPDVSIDLWKNDNLNFVDVVSEMYVQVPIDGVDLTPVGVQWARIQYYILSNALTEIKTFLLGDFRPNAIRGGSSQSIDKLKLVRALNQYFRKTASSSDMLELWLPFSVKRRPKRSAEFVLVGQLPTSALSILPSYAFANIDELSNYPGRRTFLQAYERSRLLLGSDLVRSLGKGRPLTYGDRSQDAVELSIRSFYMAVLEEMKADDMDRVGVLITDSVGLPKYTEWAFEND